MSEIEQKPTLLEIGRRCGTGKMQGHGLNYGPVFEQYLSPLRDSPIHLLELGTDEGASLKMWLEYFPRATIHGLDSGMFDKFTDDRLRVYCCDYKDSRVGSLFAANSIDVIVDDADHVPEHQWAARQFLWDSLKPGGLYFCEDMDLKNHTSEILRPWANLPNCQMYARFVNDIGVFWPDDVIVVVRK